MRVNEKTAKIGEFASQKRIEDWKYVENRAIFACYPDRYVFNCILTNIDRGIIIRTNDDLFRKLSILSRASIWQGGIFPNEHCEQKQQSLAGADVGDLSPILCKLQKPV